MALANRQFIGKYAVVGYGDRLLNADNWRVNITNEAIDITNISIFEPDETKLPFKRNTPTGLLPVTSDADRRAFFANHGTGCQHISGNKRQAKIQIGGRIYMQLGTGAVSYLPNVGDFVRILITNDAGVGVEQLILRYYCLVTEVEFSNDVRNYGQWSMTAEGTEDAPTIIDKPNSIVPY